jgi:hypothetical protein
MFATNLPKRCRGFDVSLQQQDDHEESKTLRRCRNRINNSLELSGEWRAIIPKKIASNKLMEMTSAKVRAMAKRIVRNTLLKIDTMPAKNPSAPEPATTAIEKRIANKTTADWIRGLRKSLLIM